MTEDLLVNAAFNTPSVFVDRVGDGAGSVASSPAGIDCGLDCDEEYEPGSA